MSRKSKQPEAPYSGPLFAVGETVLINRPHLWSGCVGDVVKVENGMHRIKIKARPDGSTASEFHTDVSGEMLEVAL